MARKRIFVLDGHPAETSLTGTFARDYADAATAAGHEVRVAHLSALDFDTDFGAGSYASPKPLEPALAAIAADIAWCEHVVLATPMWWGGIPAKLKGLFDRVLLPGHAFDTRRTNALGMPAPLLGGRTGRILLTSDTPGWSLRLAYGNAIVRQLRHQVFGFVGIRPARVSHFSGASHPRTGMVDRWRGQVRRIGRSAA